MRIDVLPGDKIDRCRFNGTECGCEDAIAECRRLIMSGGVSSITINVLEKREQEGLNGLLDSFRKIASEVGIAVEVVNATSDVLDVESLPTDFGDGQGGS